MLFSSWLGSYSLRCCLVKGCREIGKEGSPSQLVTRSLGKPCEPGSNPRCRVTTLIFSFANNFHMITT